MLGIHQVCSDVVVVVTPNGICCTFASQTTFKRFFALFWSLSWFLLCKFIKRKVLDHTRPLDFLVFMCSHLLCLLLYRRTTIHHIWCLVLISRMDAFLLWRCEVIIWRVEYIWFLSVCLSLDLNLLLSKRHLRSWSIVLDVVVSWVSVCHIFLGSICIFVVTNLRSSKRTLAVFLFAFHLCVR